MHDSMMMAEVGDIVKVSGSKMATPLAPPKPGSTPMSTPRITPTNIKTKFMGVSATAKPCISEPISSMVPNSGILLARRETSVTLGQIDVVAAQYAGRLQ